MTDQGAILQFIGIVIVAPIFYAVGLSVFMFRRGYRDRAYRGSWYVLALQLIEPLVNFFVVANLVTMLDQPGFPLLILTARDAVLSTLPVSVLVIPLLLHRWIATPNPRATLRLSWLAFVRWPLTCAFWVGVATSNTVLALALFVSIGVLFFTTRRAHIYLQQTPMPVSQQSSFSDVSSHLVGHELTRPRGWE